uniref:Chromosome 2 C15orf39 homolog n=1 Tax=Xiphophorus maculatus TaxID=8083 RepID=A0A3B5RES6_XIPMA
MAYRKDGISLEAGHHLPVKKGFTVYTKSPEINNLTTAPSGVIRKPKPGGENAPSPSQSSVYLAIPKPVYGISPCCTELGCVIGHRYGMEHISPRIPNTVYEHEWMQTNGHYLEKLPIQRKDAMLQQKDLQFECSAEQLKRATVEAYTPGRVRTLPSVIEPSYSGYSCTPTRTLFSSFREPSSRQLQTSPAGYPGLYAPRPTYEHMTSEVYQECSPMSKYGQLAQHPGFYYSQTNGEAENRTQRKESGSKQGEDGPLLYKHSIPSPREHYGVPPSHHTDIPLSCTEMSPNHSFIQGYDYPSYTVPRFHLNAGQIKAPLKRQNSLPAFHPSHINASSSSQHMDVPTAKEKPNTAVHIDHLHGASSFIRVNKSSPARCLNPSAVSPSRIQVSRFFQPFTSLHIDPAVHPQPASNTDRIIDHSRGEAQVKQSKSLPVSPAPWLPPSPCHSSERTHAAVPNNVRKIIYSPTVKTGSKHNGPVSDAGTSDYKKCLKRSVSHSSHPVRIKDEDVYEVECTNNKRQKVEMVKAKASNKTDSPPMPVIDNVFSLAPCQPHLQESGVSFPGRVTQKISQTSGKHNKLKQNTKENRLVQNNQESVICLESKCSSETSADESFVEAKMIKVEKADSPDADTSTKSQKRHSKVEMMIEPEETGSSVSVPVASKDKCESNELENKSLFASENTTSDELKPAELIVQVGLDNPDETTKKQAVALQPQASALLPPGKIALPAKQIPPPQPITVLTAKEEPQSPVRKHFLELHQSLCSLISKSVSASSEEDLKNWLSQLEISEPSSHLSKVQRYTAQKRCPFPHVMRTGTVFLPMLVVKELLFPTVQSCFVDKVLQEHKVELRPTTLSEEKILIQLHKRACSSKLRRLMSLKHLPDIYTEMVNLLYYTDVCKHLGEYILPADLSVHLTINSDQQEKHKHERKQPQPLFHSRDGLFGIMCC